MWYNPKKIHLNPQLSKDEEKDSDGETPQFGLWSVNKQSSLCFLLSKSNQDFSKPKPVFFLLLLLELDLFTSVKAS